MSSTNNHQKLADVYRDTKLDKNNLLILNNNYNQSIAIN